MLIVSSAAKDRRGEIGKWSPHKKCATAILIFAIFSGFWVTLASFVMSDCKGAHHSHSMRLCLKALKLKDSLKTRIVSETPHPAAARAHFTLRELHQKAAKTTNVVIVNFINTQTDCTKWFSHFRGVCLLLCFMPACVLTHDGLCGLFGSHDGSKRKQA